MIGCWPAVLICGMWLAFFWPMLTGEMVAGYRDSSYLYYPMFQWIDWQMQRGEFPLWMPYDNTGFPLLADGTSSLLYPGKAVFWFRNFSFPARYGAYLALHVLMAAGGSYFLAKTIGSGKFGATLAAISYAFGGSVLFQVCNVVYLVSAAWLPWALICVWRMMSCRAKINWAVAGSVCCSMMILGGDPQMVYHVGLIAVATIVAQTALGAPRDVGGLVMNGCGLVVLVILTTLLSAVQVLPTMEWAGLSDRSRCTVPTNLYDGNFEALVNLPNQPPVSDIYQFSQEPWSLLGFVFPNVFAMDAPVNTRWSAALPGAERIWVPSNYFGCLVFLLAMAGMKFDARKTKGRGRAGRVWLTWIAVGFVTGSLGWYGVGWLMQELGMRNAAQTGGTFSEPVGGVYWLMVIALPKYCLFRYPAKLMVIGALAMSVLAGLSLNPRGLARLYWLCFATGVIAMIGIISLFLPWTLELLKSCQRTTVFGPLVWEECWRVVLLSFLSSFVCCTLAMAAIKSMAAQTSIAKVKNSARFGWLCGGLVVLVAIELTWNNRWMLHPIAADTMTQVTETEQKIEAIRNGQKQGDFSVSVQATDFHRDSNFDKEDFFRMSSPDRVAELALWRRQTLFPKTHLLIDGVRLWGSFTSIWPVALDQIDVRTVDADAWLACDGERTELYRSTQSPDLKVIHPAEAIGWRGQTFIAQMNQSRDKPIPVEITLPIFPMPGWQAYFSGVNSDDSNERPGNENGGLSNATTQRADLLAAGPLYSRVAVPERFWGRSWIVRCVYRPDCFRRGLLLSGLGWLGVIGWTTRILVCRKFWATQWQ